MTDPFSVIVGTVSLVGAVLQTSKATRDFIVGIKGARGTSGLDDWARVIAWGRSNTGVTGPGGGVVQIDQVLLPYRPAWYVEYGPPVVFAIIGTAGIAGFWFGVAKLWRKDTVEPTYEPVQGWDRDE